MVRKIAALVVVMGAATGARAAERVEQAGLAAWVEGESIVLARGAVVGRVARAAPGSTRLRIVPARADGSDPLLFAAADNGTARLLRLDGAGQVATVWSMTASSSMGFGIGSRTRSAWLLDVDGDGTNDLVIYEATHTDVGRQEEPPQVLLQNPATGAFTPRDRKAKGLRPPSRPGGDDRAAMKLIAAALKDAPAHIERWGPARDLLGGDERTFGPTHEPGIGGGQASLLVGPTRAFVVYRFLDRRQPAPRAEAHLAVVRVFPKVELLGMAALGTVGWPPNDCRFAGQQLARDATGAIVVAWPTDASTWVTRAIPFDGKGLGAAGPIIEHSRCKK